MKEEKKEAKPKKGYWYKFYYEECVICGRESHWKERQYTPKPKDDLERYIDKQTACGIHFC